MFPIEYKVRVNNKMIRICSLFLWILAAITCNGEILTTIGEGLHMKMTITAYIAGRTVPTLIVFFFLAFMMGFLHRKITIIARHRHCCNATDTTADRDLHTLRDKDDGHCCRCLPSSVDPTCSNVPGYAHNERHESFRRCSTDHLRSIGMFNSSINFLIYSACNQNLHLR